MNDEHWWSSLKIRIKHSSFEFFPDLSVMGITSMIIDQARQTSVIVSVLQSNTIILYISADNVV